MTRVVLPSQVSKSGFLDLEKFPTGVGSCDTTLSELTACAQSQVCQEHCMVCKKSVCFWDGKGSGDLECQCLNSKMISDKIHSSYIRRIEIIFFNKKSPIKEV